MGCGALCAGSSQIKEEIKQSQEHLKQLLPSLAPNSFLFGKRILTHFLKELQLKPNNYHLVLPAKLEQKTCIKGPIMEKWRAILFSLDSDLCPYMKCLGYPEPVDKKPEMNSQADNIQANLDQLNCVLQWGNVTIIEHPCFHQIEKDLDRTFRFPQFQKQVFASVLKRIANHFPSLGYTQGVNFIVGYLLIIGFNSHEAFWIFVHLVTNPRFVFLGLFQDGFPLSNAYILIFKNILKRENPTLYRHLYENLQIDESMWLFKWFITLYIYSFPLQMCSFVFDFIVTVGGLGLVKIAVSLVNNLEKHLLQFEEACDMSQFLDKLKKVENFNTYLKMKTIIMFAYSVEIKLDDLDGLEEIKNPDGSLSFYAEYLLQSFKARKQLNEKSQNKELKNHKIIQQDNNFSINPTLWARQNDQVVLLLQNWYQTHEENRKKFIQQAKQGPPFACGSQQAFKKESTEINNRKPPKSHFRGSEQIQKNTEKLFRNQVKNSDNERKSRRSQKLKINLQEDKQSRKKSKGSIKKVASSEKSSLDPQEQQEKKDKIQIDDSLFYLPQNIILQKKHKYSGKNHFKDPSNILGNKQKDFDSRTQRQSSSIMIAGKAILSSMSISNTSNRSSVSSRQKSTQKENSSSRGCHCKSKRNGIKESEVKKTVQSQQKNTEQAGIEEIDCWEISPKGQKRRDRIKRVQKPQKQYEQQSLQVKMMFKKKHRYNETEGSNIVKMTQNSELEPKFHNHEKPGFGEDSCDSIFIPNLSHYNDIKEIQSVK